MLQETSSAKTLKDIESLSVMKENGLIILPQGSILSEYNKRKILESQERAQKKATPIGMAFLSFGKQGLVVGQRIQAVDSCFADRID